VMADGAELLLRVPEEDSFDPAESLFEFLNSVIDSKDKVIGLWATTPILLMFTRFTSVKLSRTNAGTGADSA